MPRRKASETKPAAAPAMPGPLPDLDDFLPPYPAAGAAVAETNAAAAIVETEVPAVAAVAVASASGVAVVEHGDADDVSQTVDGRWTDGMADQSLFDPFTGEIIADEDIDGLIEMYERLDKTNKTVYAVLCRIREKLAAKTEGDAKTRRVRGQTRACVLSFPSESFEQAMLKETWEEFPELRDEALKIDSIGVKLREYRKLQNTTGGERFIAFRDRLARACRGCVGLPTLKVEK